MPRPDFFATIRRDGIETAPDLGAITALSQCQRRTIEHFHTAGRSEHWTARQCDVPIAAVRAVTFLARQTASLRMRPGVALLVAAE